MQRQVVELFEQVEKKSAVITYCVFSGVSPTQASAWHVLSLILFTTTPWSWGYWPDFIDEEIWRSERCQSRGWDSDLSATSQPKLFTSSLPGKNPKLWSHFHGQLQAPCHAASKSNRPGPWVYPFTHSQRSASAPIELSHPHPHHPKGVGKMCPPLAPFCITEAQARGMFARLLLCLRSPSPPLGLARKPCPPHSHCLDLFPSGRTGQSPLPRAADLPCARLYMDLSSLHFSNRAWRKGSLPRFSSRVNWGSEKLSNTQKVKEPVRNRDGMWMEFSPSQGPASHHNPFAKNSAHGKYSTIQSLTSTQIRSTGWNKKWVKFDGLSI